MTGEFLHLLSMFCRKQPNLEYWLYQFIRLLTSAAVFMSAASAASYLYLYLQVDVSYHDLSNKLSIPLVLISKILLTSNYNLYIYKLLVELESVVNLQQFWLRSLFGLCRKVFWHHRNSVPTKNSTHNSIEHLLLFDVIMRSAKRR